MKQSRIRLCILLILVIMSGCSKTNDNSAYSTTMNDESNSTGFTQSSSSIVESSESSSIYTGTISQYPRTSANQIIQSMEQPDITANSEAYTNDQNNQDSTTAPSLESAIQTIQNRDQNSDFAYTDFGEGADDYGPYRKLKVASISAQQQGGSGTMGFVKIYNDNTIVETSDGSFEN